MEAILFLFDIVVIVVLVVFSVRDDRVPDARQTGPFRYASGAETPAGRVRPPLSRR